ncbi:hypothetical protein [Tateyamaria sp. Alg231-49]|uniref:hypothetical protein n=1 Tax=Tateyamaria sp. Alg231-49 TaxID=1922219 RepID=UPI00131F131E|nr:hypothetical protein [Tateyamaria sp. Alg231-49]
MNAQNPFVKQAPAKPKRSGVSQKDMQTIAKVIANNVTENVRPLHEWIKKLEQALAYAQAEAEKQLGDAAGSFISRRKGD